MTKYLVYFTVGHGRKYIDMLRLSVDSIQQFTNDVDYLIICDESFYGECVEKFPGIRIEKGSNSPTPEKASMRKLDIFDYGIESYDAVVYIDSDIIAHMDIKSILEKIKDPNRFYVMTESLDTNLHNHIFWSLKNYSEDELDFFRKHNVYIFNAGQFGFVPGPYMKNHFQNIRDMIASYSGEFFYEQSFMNVYFNLEKYKGYTSITDDTVFNKDNLTLSPSVDRSQEGMLLHFCGCPGNGTLKIDRMMNYIKNFMPRYTMSKQSIITLCTPYSMIGQDRMMNNMESVEYVEKNNIPGDIVEIGVWKGGSMLSMMMAYKNTQKLKRNFHMYDTFCGMTPPQDIDKDLNNKDATYLLHENHFFRCESSLEEVKRNISSNVDIVPEYHLGDICHTKFIPKNIAVLRLDTDWYESTKFELDNFYDSVTPGGVVIIDDYGHWQGCQKAVDEFLKTHSNIILKTIDYTGRYFIKPSE